MLLLLLAVFFLPYQQRVYVGNLPEDIRTREVEVSDAWRGRLHDIILHHGEALGGGYAGVEGVD